ncbi:MAG: TetR/AcrR family transcriptional regulator [Mycobacteriales bacterium]
MSAGGSPRAIQVIATARRLLQAEGAEALRMRRLAEELGIQAPSLYKHIAGRRAIEVALIELGLRELDVALRTAVAAGGPRRAVARLLGSYRQAALAEPHLYRLATAGRLPREELAPGVEASAGESFYAVTGDRARAQALWAFAHGMVILELDGRFSADSDLDRTWAAGAAAFTASRGPRPRE